MMRKALLYLFLFLNISLFATEAGYMSRFTYTIGDTLKFHISSALTTFSINIYRYQEPPLLIQTISNIPGVESSLPDSSYYYGCNWPVTYQLKIPANWQPGAYYATYSTSIGRLTLVFFIRAAVPGSFSKILVIPAINTWNAYNSYGGKSLYNFNSSGGRSYKVSFLRPDENYYSGPFDYRKNELHLVYWFYRNNISVEYASNYDLYSEPNLLSNYDLVVIAGHNEYWSYPERIQCENFIKNGGNMMILSGNTCWWQVRYENNGNTLVCYKDRTKDPLYGIIDSLVTVNFYDIPINNNENPFIGVSFRAGGFVNNNGQLTKAMGYGGFCVYNSHHWIFNGTNLEDGSILGWDESIAGNEVDGALFNYVNGIPRFTGTDNSPTSFVVFGSSAAYQTEVPAYTTNNHGFMGMFHYPGGGTVFNASSIYWNLGLTYNYIGTSNAAFAGSDTNYYVQKITKNVFDRLLINKIPPEINSWSPFDLQSKTIMNETVQINSRNFLVKSPQSFTMTVDAADPFAGTVHYKWTTNDIDENTSTSSFTKNFTSTDIINKVNRVKLTLWNAKDTTSISWNYFNTELAIYSTPPEFVLMNTKYFHRLNVYNYYQDSLVYSMTGPSWMYITRAGEIKGLAPSGGTYNVTVRVSNQHGQADSLSWALIVNSVLPVELLTFNGRNYSSYIELRWRTATEIDNHGFDIEKMYDGNPWQKIGFVQGNGNSNSYKDYAFIDRDIKGQNKISYRLKQLDNSGGFQYSNAIEIANAVPEKFSFEQNYPNPFNPTTTIRYSLPVQSRVTITIYNSLGQSINIPVSGIFGPGYHKFDFNAAAFASGVYFCRIEASSVDNSQTFRDVRKMLLIK